MGLGRGASAVASWSCGDRILGAAQGSCAPRRWVRRTPAVVVPRHRTRTRTPCHPLTSYRHLFALAGPLYVVIAFLGRLPLAMSQMGALLLVSARDRLATAPAVSPPVRSPSPTPSAPPCPVRPRRPARANAPSSLVQSAAGGARAGRPRPARRQRDAPGDPRWSRPPRSPAPFLPQIGPLARVRWRPITAGARCPPAASGGGRLLLRGRRRRGVVRPRAGPARAARRRRRPRAGLARGRGAARRSSAARSPCTPPPGSPRAPRRTRPPRLPACGPLAFVVLLVAQLLIGIVFGSVQTGTTVLATAAGRPASPDSSTRSSGSAASSLGWRSPVCRTDQLRHHGARHRGWAVRPVACPCCWVDSLGALVAVVLVLGFVVAPYMITNFTARRAQSPRDRGWAPR